LIVFADSDFDLAVSLAVEQFDNSGQVCLGAFRILVENSIADRFTQAVLEKTTTIVQGDPRDEATDMSCLITRQHFFKVDGFVRRAIAAGARPILGGSPNDELGHLYYRPTILVDAQPGSEILTEEVFGPVSRSRPSPPRRRPSRWRTTRDTAWQPPWSRVIRARRAGQRPTERWHRLGELLLRTRPRRPFGGNRQSGIGREGGIYSFDFYTDVKNTSSRRGVVPPGVNTAPGGWTS
jgi:5-carboxymethyl-2-hydroxymuconic-semialdehyde dehydrogenase